MGNRIQHRVLIVEDDEVCRMVLESGLQGERALQVRAARDSSEAWAVIEAGFKPHLCCLDLVTPGEGSLRFLERLRADVGLAETPVLLITAASEGAEIAQAIARSVQGLLLKPFRMTEVRARVMNTLRAKAADCWPDYSSRFNHRFHRSASAS